MNNSNFIKTIILCLFMFVSNIKAQSISFPSECYLLNDSTNNFIIVHLIDTLNINEIEVNIGTSLSENDLFSYSFEFDQYGSLPQTYSYLRTGNIVKLGIGEIETVPILYSRIRLMSISNAWSNWYQFISN